MWLSKAGCDLNTPEGYIKVVEAIRALPEPPSLITVDTLHRFLSGDENSAQDAKTMIDACASLMREFNCSVALVHHTGVSDEAQHRARGSSAWKGALEIEISVIPAKGDNPMQIVQRKSKDAEEAKPIYAALQLVQINGWFDEDGEPVSSAVVVQTDAPPERKKETKETGWMKMLEVAWRNSGEETKDGKPYVTRSAFVDLLIGRGSKPETAQKACSPSDPARPIGGLLNSGMIQATEHGWVIICPQSATSMMMTQNG